MWAIRPDALTMGATIVLIGARRSKTWRCDAQVLRSSLRVLIFESGRILRADSLWEQCPPVQWREENRNQETDMGDGNWEMGRWKFGIWKTEDHQALQKKGDRERRRRTEKEKEKQAELARSS
jgi:hypothetical protein